MHKHNQDTKDPPFIKLDKINGVNWQSEFRRFS
jgi:hypothetical protein